MNRLALCLTLLVSACGAQSFEVASIRVNDRGDGNSNYSVSGREGSHLAADNVTLISLLLRAFAVRGFTTSSAPSDWRIPRGALRMQQALIDATADAARTARPAHASIIAVWQEARLRHALRGRLATTIGHRDILALPGGE